jgi:hypothetical protein
MAAVLAAGFISVGGSMLTPQMTTMTLASVTQYMTQLDPLLLSFLYSRDVYMTLSRHRNPGILLHMTILFVDSHPSKGRKGCLQSGFRRDLFCLKHIDHAQQPDVPGSLGSLGLFLKCSVACDAGGETEIYLLVWRSFHGIGRDKAGPA